MNRISSPSTAAAVSPPSPTLAGAEGEGLEGLAVTLGQEMAERWNQGERPLAEEYFQRYPQLLDYPQAAVQLIFEEVCLREQHNEEVPPSRIVSRFPQWQKQLEVVLDFARVLQPLATPPRLPQVGETYLDFRLIAELGRGGVGCVYLARQPQLADRPVVLKVTPCDGHEHLSLARLQHTNIVPLHAVHEDSGRNVRALCMPYFGGTTLTHVLRELRGQPLGHLTGQHLLDLLDQAQAQSPVRLPSRGPNRQLLSRTNYTRSICWIGACLADALHYAHERGLVHLDLKPSNILLAADAQPMLLDFHLARGPVGTDTPPPAWLGGTLLYMSPEQARAMVAIEEKRPLSVPVDERSDIYSLTLVLFEALGGTFPVDTRALARLRRHNPQVTAGLANILEKGMAREPAARYPTAAALASDLRRYLTDQPLEGVASGNLLERWEKWRRRRPRALAWATVSLLTFVVGLLGGALCYTHFTFEAAQRQNRRGQAFAALEEGKRDIQDRQFNRAVTVLTHGQEQAGDLDSEESLQSALQVEFQRARRGQLADDLHTLAEELRFRSDTLDEQQARRLVAGCRRIWASRSTLAPRQEALLPEDLERRLGQDLLDLAILWTDLLVRTAPTAEQPAAHQEALTFLDDARQLYGPSAVLYYERQAHAAALGRLGEAELAASLASRYTPRTSWEHYALGRSLLHAVERRPALGTLLPITHGVEAAIAAAQLNTAHEHFRQAVALREGSFWPNYYRGTSAYRLHRYEEALDAFQSCVTLRDNSAPCYYLRGLARAALHRNEEAIADYSRALALDPRLALAALNRGVLYFKQRRYDDALADFRHALENGADPAIVRSNLALVDEAKRKGIR